MSEEAPSLPSPSGESRSSIAYSAGSTTGGPSSSGGGSRQGPTSAGGDHAGGGNEESSQWKKRVSTACLACKKSKRKVCGPSFWVSHVDCVDSVGWVVLWNSTM